MSENKRIMVLGGTGFIGRRFIQEALRRGWEVSALARSAESAEALSKAGATVVHGSADDASRWSAALEGGRFVIDLVQPARRKRLGRGQMRKMSEQRQAYAKSLVESIRAIPPERRPRLISVSGIDDLAPDADGFISSKSALETRERGFNTVGLPVRRIIESGNIEASFVYLASVYGPGGPFADAIFPAIKAGKWRDFGGPQDRMLLVHVDDVARGLVQICAIDRTEAVGSSFVIADEQPVDMAAFSAMAAAEMRVRRPAKAPTWLVALIAGRPIVETTLHRNAAKCTLVEQGAFKLGFPSYRDGVPPTLRALALSANSQ